MANVTKQKASIVIAEGQLITVDKPPTKQAYNKCLSNFWFDGQKNIFYFREHGQKKEKSIQLSFEQGKYSHEGVSSSNIYEIIVRTSIFSSLFGSTSSCDCHVAVTEESLKLPFEEQPWFIGAVDKGELKLLEQAETRMFFTRAKGPKVYLHWTTTKRMKNPERPILLESNDLSLVLPRGEFMTAKYNGGTVNYLNEFLFYRCAAANDLSGLKRIVAEKGVNLASPILHDPNVISYYIKNIPKEDIDEELIQWLLEQGLSIDKSDKELVQLAISKCSEVIVESLLQRGAYCSESIAADATKRNLPVDRLKVYWKAYCNQKPTLRDFMDIIQYYKQDMHQKQVLIMLAWRYGNADNYFKLLPKELVKYIISFDLGELEAEQPWFELAFETYNGKFTEIPMSRADPVLLKLLSFIWRYWDEATTTLKDFLIQIIIDQNYFDNSKTDVIIWMHWLGKYIQRRDNFNEFAEKILRSKLFDFIYGSPDLTLIKHLLATGILKKDWHTIAKRTKYNTYALVWRAFDYSNKELIEFLFREKMMPLEVTNKTLDTYLTGHTKVIIHFFHEMIIKYNLGEEFERIRARTPQQQVEVEDEDPTFFL